MNMERGIILGPDVVLDIPNNKLQFRSTEPNAALLRHAVLYWDKIDFPQNNVINIVSQDIEFLKQEGVAQSTHVHLAGGMEMATMYAAAQIGAYIRLTQTNPHVWTMGQRGVEFIVGGAESGDTPFLEIELNDVLPTPPDGTPLAELLDIRRKRKDEFRALRIAVDELYEEILKSAQFPRAQSAAVFRLQQAVKDIRNAVDQSWSDRVKSSVKVDFSLPKIVYDATVGSVAGHAAAAAFGVPGLEYVGAGLNAALSAIRVDAKLGGRVPMLPESSKNFAYLYHVEKEFPGTIK